MTGKERFSAAFRREKISGHVANFELNVFLTMEILGKVHPLHRNYNQWHQMCTYERELHLNDIADCHIKIAEKYQHDAIFVHPNPSDFENTKRLLEIIREKTGNQYFLMIHGDPTCGIPDGNYMLDFTCKMYEDPQSIHDSQNRSEDKLYEIANKLSKTGLLDGFALCSDYSFNTNPFFSPDQFEELIVPHLKRCIQTYHDLGFYSMKHTDGNINPILEQIVNCKPDAIHSIDPQGMMMLNEVKAKYGDRVCLVGNVNCGLLQTGSYEEAQEDVRRSLREGMSRDGYGYVFSTSNCIYTGLQLERYEMMHKIWKEEGFWK